MRPGKRRFRLEVCFATIVSGMLTFLWARSLLFQDTVRFSFSHSSGISIISGNGTVITTAEWKVPVPFPMNTGISSMPLGPNTPLRPFGVFEASAYRGRVFLIALPHWLLVVLAASAFSWYIFHRRKTVFESGREGP